MIFRTWLQRYATNNLEISLRDKNHLKHISRDRDGKLLDGKNDHEYGSKNEPHLNHNVSIRRYFQSSL